MPGFTVSREGADDFELARRFGVELTGERGAGTDGKIYGRIWVRMDAGTDHIEVVFLVVLVDVHQVDQVSESQLDGAGLKGHATADDLNLGESGPGRADSSLGRRRDRPVLLVRTAWTAGSQHERRNQYTAKPYRPDSESHIDAQDVSRDTAPVPALCCGTSR